MKLREFRRVIDAYADSQPNYSDLSVEVVLNQSSIGATPTSQVDCVLLGFDWDTGKLMLYTKDQIVKKASTK